MRFPHRAERVTHHKVVVVAPTKLDVMSSYNNSAGIPVGFRFHPTDEELVGFYLFGRITSPPPDPREEDLRIIRELDLYRHEPWDLSEVCKIPGDHSVNQNNWYFFSHKDKKYPTGNRANRATKAGFWKATGRDKCIQARAALGMRKTLVFYRGRAPHGHKTDWIMHEFRLDDGTTTGPHAHAFDGLHHEGAGAWVVCRVFRKTKNLKASCKGDNDTPTTSLEEDHQMALLPEITDSTEKLSSDEGEHVDYAPPDHMLHHYYAPGNPTTSMQQQQQQQQQRCKQEELLSVANYAHIGNVSMLAPQATSMFSSSSSSSYCNTFQLDPPSADCPGLFSAPALPSNPYLQAMLDDHVARGDIIRDCYRSAGPAMLDGLEDFTRFGCNLDQSLADVVTRPLQQQQQQQLHHSSELLSSTPHHDMVPFGLPWQGGPGSATSRTLQPPTFVDFPNTSFLSPGE